MFLKKISNANNVYLRHEIDFCYSVRIGNKSKTSSALHDTANVIGAKLVRQIAEYAKNGETRQKTRKRVQCSYDHNVSEEVGGITKL